MNVLRLSIFNIITFLFIIDFIIFSNFGILKFLKIEKTLDLKKKIGIFNINFTLKIIIFGNLVFFLNLNVYFILKGVIGIEGGVYSCWILLNFIV